MKNNIFKKVCHKSQSAMHWLPIGVAIGSGLGVATDNIAMGVGLGVAFGVIFSQMNVCCRRSSSAESEKE